MMPLSRCAHAICDSCTVININKYEKEQFIHDVNGDGSKTAKFIKKVDIIHHYIASMSM